MAHSNRELKRKQRGGKTRNQLLKSQRSAIQAERLRQTLAWDPKENKDDGKKVSLKKRTIVMFTSVKERRSRVLKRLEKKFSELGKDVDPIIKTSLIAHMNILRQRI